MLYLNKLIMETGIDRLMSVLNSLVLKRCLAELVSNGEGVNVLPTWTGQELNPGPTVGSKVPYCMTA